MSYLNREGKNYRYIWFILTACILGSFFGALLGNTVGALPSNWVKLTDFDNFNPGDITGQESNGFNFTSLSGTKCDIQGVGDSYLDIDGETSYCWFNHTTTGYFGYYMNLYQYYSAHKYSFYNQSGTEVVRLTFKTADSKVYYTDINGVDIAISAALTGTTRYFSWQYYTENIIQYKVYDTSFNLLYIVNGTGLLSGAVYTEKEQFNCSDMLITGSDINYEVKIYEYGYISEDLEEEEGCESITGVIVETNGLLGLKNVWLNSFVQYNLTVIGDAGATVFVRIFNQTWNCLHARTYNLDVSGQQFTFYVRYFAFWETGTYYFNVSDYFMDGCGDWFNYSSSFEVKDWYVAEIEDQYPGDLFAEFNTLDIPEYFVGDNVNIFYKLPKNATATNGYEDYYYALAITWNGIYTTKVYYVPWRNLGSLQIDNSSFGTFIEKGVYYIDVYNLSSYTTRNHDESLFTVDSILEYTSLPLVVDDTDTNNNGIGDSEEPQQGEYTGGANYYTFMGGIGIMIGFVCFPVVVFKKNRIVQNNLVVILLLFAMIGFAVAVWFGLFPIYISFLFGAVICGGLGLKVYSVIQAR